MPQLLDSLFRRPTAPLLDNLGEQRASAAGNPASLRNRKAAPPSSLGGAVFGTSAAERRLSAPGSTSRHLNAYAGGDDSIDWVMDAVSLIGDTAAGSPRHYERDGVTLVDHLTDDHPKGTEAAPGDLAALMNQPNAATSWSELVYLTLVDFLLVGNAYWYKFGARKNEDGKPLALFRLHPAHVTKKFAKSGGLVGYEYNPPGGGRKLVIPADEVLHFKRPNPHDEHYGAGIIAGAPRVYDLELYLTESMTSYFERGTRLSGVLETDGNVSPALFEKLKKTFKSFYSGRGNAHEVAVLERGLKYNTVSNNATDANYAQLSELSRDRILAAFRVPLSLLGGSPVGSTGGSRAEDQRVFDNKTMRPLLDKFQKAISLGLTQAWGLDFVFEYEYLPPAEDQLELAATFGTLPGVMVWEVRKKAGLDPLPDIDGTEDERNYIVLNLPGENDNASDVKDMPLGSEPGRPPNPENTAAITTKIPKDGAARVRAKNGRDKPVG